MTHFAIAGLQLDLASSDNLELVVEKTNSALARFPWVQMVLISELAVCGSGLSNAEALPSNTEKTLCDLAKKHGIWLVPGTIYEKSGGCIFNTAPVINPKGDVVVRARKMYPFYPYEKDVEPGDSVCVFEVPNVGRFGLSICYDIWFPEHSRAMINEGAEVILRPTLTNTQDRDIEMSIARATAVQNQCYVLDVNGAGAQAWGQSIFVGPEGDVVHTASRNEEIMLIEIDFARIRRTRERGIMGLGQPLKSYRDTAQKLAPDSPASNSEYLNALGPLHVPKRGE